LLHREQERKEGGSADKVEFKESGKLNGEKKATLAVGGRGEPDTDAGRKAIKTSRCRKPLQETPGRGFRRQRVNSNRSECVGHFENPK